MNVNEAVAIRYAVDAGRSRFTAQAFAEGLLSVFGHNPTIAICGFGGDARFIHNAPEAATLLLLVKADSLAVVGDMSEKDRLEMERAMREDVLEVARYPEIVYMSRNVSMSQTAQGQHRVAINGDLSLHGVTRHHLIEARVTVNGAVLRAQGEFTLRQTDYNIKPVSVAGGTLKVKDELKFSFDITARQSSIVARE